MLRLNDTENAELFAQMVKIVRGKDELATPEISPVVLFISRLPRREGLTSQDEMSPPDVMGARETTVTFTIKSRSFTS